MGLAPSGTYSREAKWAYDVDYLSREIKRRHISPFRVMSPAQLDSMVAAFKSTIAKSSDAQLELGIQWILRAIGDGHTSLMPRAMSHGMGDVPNVLDSKQLPIRLFDFEEGVFVVEAATEYQNLIGKQVTAIDAHSIDKVKPQVYGVVSSDSSSIWQREMGARKLSHTVLLNTLGFANSEDEVELTFSDGTRSKVKSVKGEPQFAPAA